MNKKGFLLRCYNCGYSSYHNAAIFAIFSKNNSYGVDSHWVVKSAAFEYYMSTIRFFQNIWNGGNKKDIAQLLPMYSF